MKTSLFLTLAFVCAFANASELRFGSPGTLKLGDVTVSETVKLEVAGKSVELKRVAQGLRQKQIAFIWPKVYAAQFFTNGKVDLTSTENFRTSLLANLPVVVSMTFVRDVDSKKIIDGYTEVLKEDVLVQVYLHYSATDKTAADLKN